MYCPLVSASQALSHTCTVWQWIIWSKSPPVHHLVYLQFLLQRLMEQPGHCTINVRSVEAGRRRSPASTDRQRLFARVVGPDRLPEGTVDKADKAHADTPSNWLLYVWWFSGSLFCPLQAWKDRGLESPCPKSEASSTKACSQPVSPSAARIVALLHLRNSDRR